MNATRHRSITRMLTRHRYALTQGYHGCLCGKVKISSHLDHTRHLADLVEALIEEALDATFGDHARYRNNPKDAA